MIPSNFAGMEDLVIQGVTVCVNFGDYLEETLTNNLGCFDQFVVVTDTRDNRTANLCNKLSVNCIRTDDFYIGGDNFNKGRAINIGLAHLSPGGWRLHLDADIALPPTFRQMIRRHPLDKEFLYGADRLNVVGYPCWCKVKKFNQYNYNYMVTPDPTTNLGSRLVHNEWGYCPIGYFQLWHSSRGVRYPINQGSAEHTDVTFAQQWAREKRALIPELLVYHLESEGSKFQGDWNGRTSPDFKTGKPLKGEALDNGKVY